MMMYKVTGHVIHYRLSFVQAQFAKIWPYMKSKFSTCSLSQAFPTQLLHLPVKSVFVFLDVACHRGVCSQRKKTSTV